MAQGPNRPRTWGLRIAGCGGVREGVIVAEWEKAVQGQHRLHNRRLGSCVASRALGLCGLVVALLEKGPTVMDVPAGSANAREQYGACCAVLGSNF
ncbi:fructose-1,6-bisphosphatase/inositol monophosphatase family enzyme [Azospirillum canadense]|nr:fructose-1,6-bisphosphatase/inositol monophosphatase family enzyme [Azospirillum canadense]